MCKVLNGHDYSKDARVEMNGNGNGARSWEWFWRVLSVIAIPWAMWMSVMLIDVRERVAVIEGNRFNSQDAYKLMQIIDSKAERAEVPPAWFLREFNELEGAFLDHLEDTR